MPDHSRAFPFAYRLPTDVASQIRNSASPVVGVDHTRRRAFVATILAVGLAGGVGAAVVIPPADAMRVQNCGPGWTTDGVGRMEPDGNFRC